MRDGPQSGERTTRTNLGSPIQIVAWVCSGIVAIILLMAGVNKFMYDETTREIFEVALGGGRAFASIIGIVEIAAGVLILIPKFTPIGGLLAMGVMLGAIGSHVAVLGFEGEAGGMAGMAVVVFIAAAIATYIRRGALLRLLPKR